MDFSDLLDSGDRTGISGWLREAEDLYVYVSYPHTAGAEDRFMIRSVDDLLVVLRSIEFREFDLHVCRGAALPFRGVASDSFLSEVHEGIGNVRDVLTPEIT